MSLRTSPPLVVAQEGVRKALPYPVWPIPQEAEISDARLLLADAVIVVPDGDREAQYPGRLLSELIADHFMAVVPVVVGSAPEGKTPIVVGQIGDKLVADAARSAGLKITAADPGPEGYALKVDDNGAVIAGCDYRGALYGVSTFRSTRPPVGSPERGGPPRDHPRLAVSARALGSCLHPRQRGSPLRPQVHARFSPEVQV